MRDGRPSAAPGLLACALVLAFAAPARAEDLDVSIVGDPVVGEALLAVAPGDPSTIEYSWKRCATAGSKCEKGVLSTTAAYVPVEADEGWWLKARATIAATDQEGSSRIGPVQPAPVPEGTPGPTPLPDPEPTPQPFPPDVPPPPLTGATSTPPPGYLRPFPVVRIRGSVAERGARVTLLRVTAPRRARVNVRCAGPRCPVRRRTQRPGRIRPFERFLPAGLRITIRVRRQGLVGKYVRLTVRAGKPPARNDACLIPGSRRPVSCPPA